MTTTLTLISTIYSIEPVIVCATRFSPWRIILLTEEKAPEEKERAEKMITDTLGSVFRIQSALFLRSLRAAKLQLAR